MQESIRVGSNSVVHARSICVRIVRYADIAYVQNQRSTAGLRTETFGIGSFVSDDRGAHPRCKNQTSPRPRHELHAATSSFDSIGDIIALAGHPNRFSGSGEKVEVSGANESTTKPRAIWRRTSFLLLRPGRVRSDADCEGQGRFCGNPHRGATRRKCAYTT